MENVDIKNNLFMKLFVIFKPYLISFVVYFILWFGIGLEILSFTYATLFIFIVYTIYYFFLISKQRKLLHAFLIPLLFWVITFVLGLFVNQGNILLKLLPFTLTIILSFAVAYVIVKYKAMYGFATILLGITIVLNYINFILPISFYHDSEIKGVLDEFSAVKEKKHIFLTAKGDTVTLEDVKNRVVFLEFSFSSCLPCKLKLPTIKKLRDYYNGNDNILFIGITDGRIDSFSTFQAEAKEQNNVFNMQFYAPKETFNSLEKLVKLKGYPFEKVYDNNYSIFTHVGFSEQEKDYYYETRIKAFNKILKQ